MRCEQIQLSPNLFGMKPEHEICSEQLVLHVRPSTRDAIEKAAAQEESGASVCNEALGAAVHS